MCLFGKCDYEDGEGECILKSGEKKPCNMGGKNEKQEIQNKEK
jgi:hypothetical protein